MTSRFQISAAASPAQHALRLSLGAALLVGAATALLPARGLPADAMDSLPGKVPPVTLESVPGQAAPRIVLSARAAERLGIATGQVSEAAVVRRQMVSGMVVPPMDRSQAGSAPAPAAGGLFGVAGRPGKPGAAEPVAAVISSQPGPGVAPPAPGAPVEGEVWVQVSLSPGEWERLDKEQPARLLPLGTREGPAGNLVASPSGVAPQEDLKRSMLALYYVVPGKDHGLALNRRMRVELQLAGNHDKQPAVPYGAVYYDARGKAWVYVQERPLTYQRQPIVVDRVVGDMALISEGPALGTTVVTVGAALLYGTETFKK